MRQGSALLVGLVLALAAGCEDVAPPAAVPDSRPIPAGPSIVLFSADTLRADRVSAYGHTRTTPHIDRLASEGLLFERAYAPASWTLPSHMTVFTSLLPTSHGVTGHLAGLGGHQRPSEVYNVTLGSAAPTLAELLHAAGYDTAAITENGWMNAKFGFDRGFELYRGPWQTSLGNTCPAALELLAEPRERPFFLFVHTYATHIPYDMPAELLTTYGDASRKGLLRWGEPPHPGTLKQLMEPLFPPVPDDEQALNDIYDCSVKHLDGCIGSLLGVGRGGRDPGAVAFVFFSDHGEELWEHGLYGHGDTLYEEVLGVPLIVWAPGRVEAGRRSDPVGVIDIMPTVLELAGVPAPEGLAGRSLLVPSPEPRPVLAEGHTRDGVRVEAIVSGHHKLIRYADRTRGDELYDLETDPGESRNLLEARPELADRLRAELAAALAAARARAVPPDEAPSLLSAEERERLRALGYLGGE